MKTKLFRLKGIKEPGRVDVYKHGLVVLSEVDDKKAMQLYKEGVPYLEPTSEGRKKLFPGEKPIDISKIDLKKTVKNK